MLRLERENCVLRSVSLTRGAGLAICAVAFLAACGSGDAPPSETSQEPLLAQAQSVSEDPQASTAPALPTPVSADVPVLQSVPPAPADETPTRAPNAGSTKLPLASDAGLVMPSVLRQTVAAGLAAPTDMAFSTDGILFYTERLQGLFVQRPGQPAAPLFAPKELGAGGSLGMLSVAVDPDFTRNRFVYVFVKTVADRVDAGRVVRLTLDESSAKVVDRREILVAVSEPPAVRGAPQAGGGLRFGPDGFLYVGLGDGRAAATPQSPLQLRGKVLRIDREGKAAPSNRPPPGFDGRIYAYGLRDPVALAFHPNTETLLVAQRRGSRPDDLTWLQPGANAGWDPRCSAAESGYCESTSDTGTAERGWRGGKAGEGVTAVERLRDPMWREWRNAFVVAFDKAQRLDLVKFDAQGRVVQATPVVQKLGVGFKAIAQGPDALYVMTSGKTGGEEIWRLSAQ